MNFDVIVGILSLALAAWLLMRAFIICVDKAGVVDENERLHEELAARDDRHRQNQQYLVDRMVGHYDQKYIEYLIARRMGLIHEHDNNQDEIQAEKPPLRIHQYRANIAPSEHRRERPRPARPAYVFETDDDEAWQDHAQHETDFRQPETLSLEMRHLWHLPLFDDDDEVIDVPVVRIPPPTPPKRGRGRPKKYENSAEKQRAYRERERNQ